MNWFSNLNIKLKLFLVYSLEIVFIIIICATAYFQLNNVKIHLSGVSAGPEISIINQSISTYLIVALVISVFFIFLVTALTLMTAKAIADPLERLSTAAEDISKGYLDGPSLASNRKDEVGQLSRNFDRVRSLLQSINDDIKSLSERHNIDGDIYAKIDSEKYDGPLKETTEGLNAMLWQYIADGRDIMYCINEYTIGNFNTQVRTFPGVRSTANNVAYGLRKTLVSLCEDMEIVMSSGANGNFSKRLDMEYYKGEWNVVADRVNKLLDSISEPISETTSAMIDIYEGHLNPITSDLKGDFALIKTSVNNALDSISGVLRDTVSTINELADRNAEVEITAEFPGEYEKLKFALVSLAESLKSDMLGFAGISSAISEHSAKAADVAELVKSNSNMNSEILEIIDGMRQKFDGISEAGKQSISDAAEAVRLSKENPINDDQIKGIISPIMDSIKESNANISKIIEIVEDMAFESNLLALNASAEAARAAEHGEGFKEVAEGIRGLAERSQDAAMEAGNLLNLSQSKVSEGETQIDELSESIKAGAQSGSDISKILEALTESMDKQLKELAEVSDSFSHMSEINSKSAEMLETATSSACNLVNHSEELLDIANVYLRKK